MRFYLIIFNLFACLGLADFCIAENPSAIAKPMELKIQTEEVIQDNFLGLNATYHGFAFMPEQAAKGMNDADRTREFDRVSRMGLHIARTWYRPDWVVGDTLTNEFHWDTVKFKAFCQWLQAMKDRNVDVALQAGWWFTKDTYYGNAGPNPEKDLARYAEWVSESIHQLVEIQGFTNIKYLILFTEPTTYNSGIIPEGKTQWQYYKEAVTAIREKLQTDGRLNLVKLVGPNNSNKACFIGEAAKELNDGIDIYSGHDYNLKNYKEWYTLFALMQEKVSGAGKPVWLDEYGKADEKYRLTADYGNYVAQVIAASLNAGIQTSFMWLLFDQQYVAPGTNTTNNDSFVNGVHRWGTCKWPHDTIENPTLPYPHWYAFSLMSKSLGGGKGTKVFKTTGLDDLHIAAVQQPSGDWSVLVVNEAEVSREFSIQFSSRVNKTFYRYLYDPAKIIPTEAAELIGYSTVFSAVEKELRDTIPAKGVAVYSTVKGL